MKEQICENWDVLNPGDILYSDIQSEHDPLHEKPEFKQYTVAYIQPNKTYTYGAAIYLEGLTEPVDAFWLYRNIPVLKETN